MKEASFIDFPVGREIVTGRVTVTESHLVQWAGLTGDWYPIHMDAAYAKDSPFGERIGHGPLTFGLAVGLMAQAGEFGNAIIAWLGVNNLKALAPVRIGDTIGVKATVESARLTKDGERGVVIFRYVVTNSDGVDVMEFEFSLMMRVSSPVADV